MDEEQVDDAEDRAIMEALSDGEDEGPEMEKENADAPPPPAPPMHSSGEAVALRPLRRPGQPTT